jgi:predicted Zn-dependent peptidase
LSETVRTTRLDNGIRVVTESADALASAALGIWIENGSRHETRSKNGISHFIEHMLFKGTEQRSAFEIADEIESLGGSINAFTTKDCTCFHTRTLGDHVPQAFDVLGDIVLHSELRAEDLEIEREVILQEIFDVEDSPEDFVHDFFLEQYWPGHPLGWSVTGTPESVTDITRDDIVSFLSKRYLPERIIVAAAGNVDHDAIVELTRKHFSGMRGSAPAPEAVDRPDFNPSVFSAYRDLEQVHLVVGFPGVSLGDPRRETAELIVAALGGGMSSRLFQSVREERGLSYSVYAFQSPFEEIGYTGIYAATAREHVAETVGLILDEVADIRAKGLAPDELRRLKQQLVGAIPLALESTESRMFRIARNEIYFGRDVPIAEVVRDIQAIDHGSVVELAREIFSVDRLGIAMLGDADADLLSVSAG